LRFRGSRLFSLPRMYNIVALSIVPPLNKKLPVSTESQGKGNYFEAIRRTYRWVGEGW